MVLHTSKEPYKDVATTRRPNNKDNEERRMRRKLSIYIFEMVFVSIRHNDWLKIIRGNTMSMQTIIYHVGSLLLSAHLYGWYTQSYFGFVPFKQTMSMEERREVEYPMGNESDL